MQSSILEFLENSMVFFNNSNKLSPSYKIIVRNFASTTAAVIVTWRNISFQTKICKLRLRNRRKVRTKSMYAATRIQKHGNHEKIAEKRLSKYVQCVFLSVCDCGSRCQSCHKPSSVYYWFLCFDKDNICQNLHDIYAWKKSVLWGSSHTILGINVNLLSDKNIFTYSLGFLIAYLTPKLWNFN